MVRYKNRYIVAEIVPENHVAKFAEYKINESVFFSVLRHKIQQLYGDFGAAATCNGFSVKFCNANLRTVLIRVRHGPHRFVTSALPFVDRVSDKRLKLNTLYLGATMRNCFKFLVKYHKKKALLDLKEFKGTKEYNELYRMLTFVKC